MIHLRLKEERERLGLTQTALAVLASAAKRTVIDWEKGVSSPTAVQLRAAAAAGVDVLYVITSERSQPVAEMDLLPADERALVDAYRRCNAEARRNLIQTAALLSAGMPPGAAPAASKMVNKAAGSVQVGYQSGGRSGVINVGKKGGK